MNMNTLKSFRSVIIWLLVLLMAMPPQVFAQEGKTTQKQFSQEELDQVLAPIALYPDSLLAQIFMAATYPLEVVSAERWAQQNKNLNGDELNNALDKQPWDASVKALVPFRDVLSMMSQKLDWTRKVGDAFLSQQNDVMDTVQKLRKRAADAGNLKTTEQQKVIVEGEAIRVEPVDPRVVYVPVYNPQWVYGPWWWPAYPPYVVYPYPAEVVLALASGLIWFGVGLAVSAFWGIGWGYWGWHNHGFYANVNRNINVNGNHVGAAFSTAPWTHNPAHRGGVAYQDQATRERFGQQANRAAVESRRNLRGYEGNWIERGARTSGTANAAVGTGRPGTAGRPDTVSTRTGRPDAVTSRASRPDTVSGRTGRPDAVSARTGRPDAVTGRTSRSDVAVSRQAPGQQGTGRTFDRSSAERTRSGRAFEGISRGSEVSRQSNWGRESLNASRSGSRTVGNLLRGVASSGAGRGSAGGGFGGGFMHIGHR
jgi:hypothetical protein